MSAERGPEPNDITDRPSQVRTLLVVVLAVVALVVAACSDSVERGDAAAEAESAEPATDSDDSEADGASIGTGQGAEDGATEEPADEPTGGIVDITPVFVEGPCTFSVPPGSNPTCGTVEVPMNWSTGDGAIELAVAVFGSTSAAPATDPIVYLEGGPGGHALDSLVFSSTRLVDPLRERGDVIVFDQRGVGRSRPALHCPEVDESSDALADDPTIDSETATEQLGVALAACSARLTESGVDLATFTTENNAHDVDAIRRALGFEQWNLLGISYGTKLGLEVLRQHPEGVRAAVLDSVFPQQVDSVQENPTTFLDSLDAVVAACGAEPACAAEGDLGRRLVELVNRLEATPIQVEATNAVTGATDDVWVDGQSLISLINQSLYTPLWFGDLPELIAELEAGEVRAIESFLTQAETADELHTIGMFFAVQCNEEIPFADPTSVATALPEDPYGLSDRFDYTANIGLQAFESCDAFGSVVAPEIADEAVTSDVPTLVMAGRFDPVTPVRWSELAAETLVNSHLVVHPAESHGISPGPCGTSIVVAFLDDPATAPDTACFAETEVTFLAAADPSVELETTQRPIAGGATFTTVRPVGWQHGGLPGDSYRQLSFLDPTQLIQVAADPALILGIELYLDRTFDVQLGPTEEVVGPAARTWRRRTGENAQVAVDWYRTEIAEQEVLVVLVSTPSERQATIDAVLTPALQAIDIAGV